MINTVSNPDCSGIALAVEGRSPVPLYPKTVTKEGLQGWQGAREGGQGERPYPKRPKGSPSSPISGVCHALAVQT